MRRAVQAFYKRFSGPIRTLPAGHGGADAWQITTCGHGVLQTTPGAGALELERLSGSLIRRVGFEPQLDILAPQAGRDDGVAPPANLCRAVCRRQAVHGANRRASTR